MSVTARTKPEDEPSSPLPVAAVAAVALGTLGLVAWARSHRRGARGSGSASRDTCASTSAEPQRRDVPAGVRGDVHAIGAHVIVVAPLGVGARARVYGRVGWDAALRAGVAPPDPVYEACRMSSQAAQLAAMAYVRAQERERWEN